MFSEAYNIPLPVFLLLKPGPAEAPGKLKLRFYREAKAQLLSSRPTWRVTKHMCINYHSNIRILQWTPIIHYPVKQKLFHNRKQDMTIVKAIQWDVIPLLHGSIHTRITTTTVVNQYTDK